MGVYAKLNSYWRMETTGSRADEIGGVTLSDNNTVATGTGKQGNCADFEFGNSEFLHNATATNIRPGSQSCFFFGWISFESQGAIRDLWSKWLTTGNQREYNLLWNNVNSRLQWTVSSDGTSTTTAVWSGVTGTGTLFFVYVYYDHANSLIGIDVNNSGSPVTQSHSGIHTGTAQFQVGVRQGLTTYHDGLVDELGYGAGNLLTADELTWLYGGGNGRAWDEIHRNRKTDSRVMQGNLIHGGLIC